MQAKRLTPILNVSNIQESFAWFEKFGWQKGAADSRQRTAGLPLSAARCPLSEEESE